MQFVGTHAWRPQVPRPLVKGKIKSIHNLKEDSLTTTHEAEPGLPPQGQLRLSSSWEAHTLKLQLQECWWGEGEVAIGTGLLASPWQTPSRSEESLTLRLLSEARTDVNWDVSFSSLPVVQKAFLSSTFHFIGLLLGEWEHLQSPAEFTSHFVLFFPTCIIFCTL